MRGEARIRIKAPPERVWELVADVTRMGEWSPECVRCEWLDGASSPTAGARFRGHNKWGPFTWSTVATVTAVEPGRELAFVTNPGETTWRYRFESADGGTELTESYEKATSRVQDALFKLMGRPKQLTVGVRRTLARIKAAAEAG